MRCGIALSRASAAVAALLVAAAAPSVVAASSLAPQKVRPASVDRAVPAESAEVPVIVQARPGRSTYVAGATARAGGRIGVSLPIIDGFAARVSGPAVAALAASPDVIAVTRDRAGAFQSAQVEPRPSTESNYSHATQGDIAERHGIRGQGVTVALLDTGISPMPDLKDQTLPGADLSGEGSPIDTYGHGTAMAGIIAGRSVDGPRSGIAPGAGLVSVKVAGRNGAVDVSTVLLGMAWVAAHREQLGIRVLNLSYGTTSTQDPTIDPLNFAVQRLWADGIVVVVAAGNGGPGPGTITKPGDDPVVLTVGAFDDGGDRSLGNDVVPAWSSRGPTAGGVSKPDLVAPGRSLVTTRSYGSTVERENPQSLLPPSYLKGSGTSEATAVTSGLAALLLEVHPTWTPDQVKQALTSTAARLPQATAEASGHGRPRVMEALKADPGPAVQQHLTATGLGSLEASRGGAHVTTSCGEIVGEQDVMCQPWDAATWTGPPTTGVSWTGVSWTGVSWTGVSWTGVSWMGHSESQTLTAFWGDQPKSNEAVNGETSAPVGEEDPSMTDPADEDPSPPEHQQTGSAR